MIVRGCPQMADKVISCGVCKKLPESPRKLPCNHVFCESCLRGFIASHQYDKFGYFPCPQCRYGIIVPIGGIRQFKFYDSSIGFKCKDEIVPPDLHFLLREPVGLACTSNDLVAISDRDGNKLLLFTLHRELVSRFFCKVKINSLIVSDADTLLVTNNDIHQPLVLEFGLNGVRSGIVDTLDKMVPTDGVALLRNPKQIVVSSVETSTLYILDENGKLLKKYSGKSLLGNPQFLSANSQNEIIVSDNLNHFVKVVDHNGKLKFQMGGVGTNNENLFEPKGVCVDKMDNIIVADSGNRCIKCFSRSGKFLRILLCCSDQSKRPINVALTRNCAYLIVLLTGSPPNFEVVEYIPPK